MEAQLRRQRARRHVVRSAEGGKEVIERHLVGHVDGRKPQAPLVTVAVEQVVVAHRDVEQIARCDAGRIVVIILGAGRGN